VYGTNLTFSTKKIIAMKKDIAKRKV